MRSLNALIAVCLVVLTIGCMSGKVVDHDVNYDFDVNADFSQLKTYKWVSMPATLRINEFNRSRIMEYANSELMARGLVMTEDSPDMYIVMFGGGYKQVDTTTLMDYEVYTVGRLKLAIYEAKDNREIWWGETKANLDYSMSPAEKDDVTKSAVTKILENYPPGRTDD